MKKHIFITVLFLVAMATGIGIASAETVTGSVGTGEGWTSSSYAIYYPSWMYYANQPKYLSFNDIQNAQGMISIIDWYILSGVSFDSGSPTGASTPCTIWNTNMTDGSKGSTQKGTCTIGYQRAYVGSTESGSYLWLILDEKLSNTDTGDVVYYVDYATGGLYNMTMSAYPTSGNTPPSGGAAWAVAYGVMGACFGSQTPAGYTLNRDLEFHNTYTATKPAGLGISGYVNKTIDGDVYQSRVYVVNASDNVVVSSEDAVGPNDYTFTNNKQQIYFAIQDSNLTWWNTSTLFSPGTGYPTPTPTLTPSPDNPIPDGYVRSMCQAVDGRTSGAVHGADLQIKDVENGTWSNITDRFDGTWYVDTLPDHTIDCYAQADGYIDTYRTGLAASGTAIYELIMQPDNTPAAPEGKVKLFVIVNDYDTSKAIYGATVTAYMYQDSTIAGQTNPSGTVQFTVVNATAYYVTAEKAGYGTVTRSGTTTDYGPDTIRIELRKQTVTPTATGTILPGDVTVRPTLDARTNAQKDDDLMNLIRNNAEALVTLAIMMTMIYLVGGIGGRK